MPDRPAGAGEADACNYGVSGVEMIAMSSQTVHLMLLIYSTEGEESFNFFLFHL